MTKYAILVAGGSGTRMGGSLPKQFLLLKGQPVLMHTLQRFADTEPEAHLILVLPADQQQHWQRLCQEYRCRIRHEVVTGGSTRFASVRNGLQAIRSANGLVAVHDGVRPLVTPQLIRDCYRSAAETGSGVAAVPLKDSVRELIWGAQGASRAIDRTRLRLVQTPQAFRLSLLRDAFDKATSEHFTDDASVAEAAGHAVQLVEGSYRNIKITTPEDLVLAEALLKKIED